MAWKYIKIAVLPYQETLQAPELYSILQYLNTEWLGTVLTLVYDKKSGQNEEDIHKTSLHETREKRMEKLNRGNKHIFGQ